MSFDSFIYTDRKLWAVASMGKNTEQRHWLLDINFGRQLLSVEWEMWLVWSDLYVWIQSHLKFCIHIQESGVNFSL